MQGLATRGIPTRLCMVSNRRSNVSRESFSRPGELGDGSCDLAWYASLTCVARNLAQHDISNLQPRRVDRNDGAKSAGFDVAAHGLSMRTKRNCPAGKQLLMNLAGQVSLACTRLLDYIENTRKHILFRILASRLSIYYDFAKHSLRITAPHP
jgi:hypothetical protein